MKQITLTQKDIEKAKIQNSPSGMLIDELAYSAGQWTSEDLYSNNYEYEPNEPYSFDYEADLFLKTKTHPELCNTAREIGYEGNLPSLQMCIKKGTTLQAGVFTALRLPEIWSALLEMYTNKLKEDRTDGISEAYNTQLQEEIDEYQEEQYREWLNGDRSNYAGVVKEIARYFTESGQGAV
jgi:hypothetical protein